MINTDAPSYYSIRCDGEGAQNITSEFMSDKVSNDITSVAMVSQTYSSDIQTLNEFDRMMAKMKALSGYDGVKNTKFNPLYLPVGKFADVLEVVNVDSIKFTGMNGDAFAIKTVELTPFNESSPLLFGRAVYEQFTLPSYSEIIKAEEQALLN
jgi:hypothetical protein